MARYYGDFRSLDTSNDPKGQAYRVLIFTDFNGSAPYQYEPTSLDPDARLRPIQGTELTLTDHPFTVTYEGDAENIYKPYRCSTASVTWLQSELDMSLLSANGTSVLVMLLKWRNEVSASNNKLVNSSTGEVLHKLTITDGTFVLYNDYEPYKYDRFCYTVEWMGYATPETFSMGYDHVTDSFTLNCQDALSTLQYVKYSTIGDSVQLLSDAIIQPLAKVGFNKVYITNSVKFPTIAGSNPTTALAETIQQTSNWYDEDGQPSDQLAVIEGALRYMGLTAIPYRDSVVITTPNAIAERWVTYNVWTKPTSNYITPTDTQLQPAPSEQLEHLYAITESSHSGGTTISTTNCYNSVKLTCDEYPVDTLLPSINDADNLTDGTYEMSHDYFFIDGSTRQYWTWEHEFFGSTNPKLELYQYEGNPTGAGWGTPQCSPSYAFTPSNKRRPTGAVLDDGGFRDVNYVEVLKSPYNPKRVIYFRTPTGFANRENYDDTSQYWQPLLHATTKPILINEGYLLQIKGSWSFFTTTNDALKPIPYVCFPNSIIADAIAMPQYSHVYAKVKCGSKWLANNSYGFIWSDTEQVVSLMLDVNTDTKAFGSTIPFAREYRNYDGIVVPLPLTGDDADFTEVEIWINRPLGVFSVLCESATLTDFSFDVITVNDLHKKTPQSDTNTEYKDEMNPQAVTEYPSITNQLSSDKLKGIRHSQTARIYNQSLHAMTNVYNAATGNYTVPEKLVTNQLSGQYKQPSINLELELHNDLTPYTCITWSQLPSRTFIPNGIAIDYEYNTATVTASEVIQPAASDTTKRNATRNQRRNRDVLYRKSVPSGNPVTVATPLTVDTSRTITATTNGVILTTESPIEGAISVDARFSDGDLIVSVPDGVEAYPTITTNGTLLLQFEP